MADTDKPVTKTEAFAATKDIRDSLRHLDRDIEAGVDITASLILLRGKVTRFEDALGDRGARWFDSVL